MQLTCIHEMSAMNEMKRWHFLALANQVDYTYSFGELASSYGGVS